MEKFELTLPKGNMILTDTHIKRLMCTHLNVVDVICLAHTCKQYCKAYKEIVDAMLVEHLGNSMPTPLKTRPYRFAVCEMQYRFCRLCFSRHVHERPFPNKLRVCLRCASDCGLVRIADLQDSDFGERGPAFILSQFVSPTRFAASCGVIKTRGHFLQIISSIKDVQGYYASGSPQKHVNDGDADNYWLPDLIIANYIRKDPDGTVTLRRHPTNESIATAQTAYFDKLAYDDTALVKRKTFTIGDLRRSKMARIQYK